MLGFRDEARHAAWLFGAASFCGLGLLSRPALGLPLEEIIRQAKPAVVHLSTRNSRGDVISTGSGFLISADGRVATNFHVVDSAQKVEALFDGGMKRSVIGAWVLDEKADIAVLQLALGDYPSLTLAASAARQGDAVFILGSPLGFSGTMSTGIVSAIRGAGDNELSKRHPEWTLQVTAPISPGSSGSPILNDNAEVVGLAVGTLMQGQALNFGLPVSKLQSALDRAPKQLGPLATGRTVRQNITISAVAIGAVALISWIVTLLGRRNAPKKPHPSEKQGIATQLLRK